MKFIRPGKLLVGGICGIGLMLGLGQVHASDGRLEIGLEVTVQSRDGRDVPEYRVSIKNVSGETVSIVDVRADADVRERLAPVQIISADPAVGVRPALYNVDHWPDFDYVVLTPGESLEYVAASGIFLSELVQGRYLARMLFFPDPEDPRTAYASPIVEFEISNGPPPSEARKREVPEEQVWSMRCVVPGNRRSCFINYRSAKDDPYRWTSWALTIDSIVEFAVTAHQSRVCGRLPVVMRIDRNRPIEFPWRGAGYRLEGDGAHQLVDQLLAGKELEVRVHMTRDCIAHEVRIPLDGFRSIWREFEAVPLPD